MMKKHLTILGKAGSGIHKDLYAKFNIDDHEITFFFADYATFEIELGFVFNSVYNEKEPEKVYSINAFISHITQSYFVPLDEMSIGHRSIIGLKPNNEVPEILQGCSVIEHWNKSTERIICTGICLTN